ncbi:MAG: DUF134 domain-containing protein [Elusimicrobiales bacterium]|nr:DUF134 domain-containing protein [Elusimicrobiales bacterium]
MARPVKCRNIESSPRSYYFKPRGIPMFELEEICLAADEFQALKYADADAMMQTEAAALMGISRQTFGNILARARAKVAVALIHGKALRIENANTRQEHRTITGRPEIAEGSDKN